jgi:hypothetical protein
MTACPLHQYLQAFSTLVLAPVRSFLWYCLHSRPSSALVVCVSLLIYDALVTLDLEVMCFALKTKFIGALPLIYFLSGWARLAVIRSFDFCISFNCWPISNYKEGMEIWQDSIPLVSILFYTGVVVSVLSPLDVFCFSYVDVSVNLLGMRTLIYVTRNDFISLFRRNLVYTGKVHMSEKVRVPLHCDTMPQHWTNTALIIKMCAWVLQCPKFSTLSLCPLYRCHTWQLLWFCMLVDVSVTIRDSVLIKAPSDRADVLAAIIPDAMILLRLDALYRARPKGGHTVFGNRP